MEKYFQLSLLFSKVKYYQTEHFTIYALSYTPKKYGTLHSKV